jgi:hypothetical protein
MRTITSIAAHLLLTVTLMSAPGLAGAAPQIPAELVGIWASEGAQFNGEALMNGAALYLDTDGIGAGIGGNGKVVLGVRAVVTAYNADTRVLSLDYTENGKVVMSGTFTYDSINSVLLSARPVQEYKRRFATVSPAIRRSLGLESKGEEKARGAQKNP